MLISTEQFKNGIMKFVDEVILPRSEPLKKFAISFMVVSNQNKLDDLVKVLGIADANNQIDLEVFFENAKKALEKSGGSFEIPYINWNFDKDDLTKIYNILKGDTKYE